MPRPPDIIWILTTQWRGQALGCMGDLNACTPNLDRLASQGINFTQAITPHPFGPFARAALFTGTPSPRNGIRHYYDALPRNAVTIAHRMGQLGYATAFLGKWHLSHRDPSEKLVSDAHAKQFVPPEDRGGFMFWEGFESGFQINNPWLHGTCIREPKCFPGYQSDVLCQRAAEYIREYTLPRERPPLFFVLSMEPPHPPYQAPASGVAQPAEHSLALMGNVPIGDDCETQARKELAGYYAHLEATDRALGQLLLGNMLNRAIVVFSSVHGDMHGSHGLFRKGWPYEESIRVPLIVRPALEGSLSPFSKGGEISEAPVSLLDLYRWTLDWARTGFCSTHTRSTPYVECSMPSVVELPMQCTRTWRLLRSPNRKLVLNHDGSPWLFFDLQHDPLEQHNLTEVPAWQRELEEIRKAIDHGPHGVRNHPGLAGRP